jgi:hypothetical protein
VVEAGQEDAAEGGAAVLEEELSFYRIQTDLLVKPDSAGTREPTGGAVPSYQWYYHGPLKAAENLLRGLS